MKKNKWFTKNFIEQYRRIKMNKLSNQIEELQTKIQKQGCEILDLNKRIEELEERQFRYEPEDKDE